MVLIRDGVPADAAALAPLFAALGHDADVEGLARRLHALPVPTLVAEVDGRVAGACGLDIQHHVHRPAPVGRIAILIVDGALRGQGLGRLLVDEAERRLAAAGCTLLELTSNNRLEEAHRFYRHLGFAQTSRRLAKPLA